MWSKASCNVATIDQASSVGPDRSGFSSASQPFLPPLTLISFPITSRRLTPLARRLHSLEPETVVDIQVMALIVLNKQCFGVVLGAP